MSNFFEAPIFVQLLIDLVGWNRLTIGHLERNAVQVHIHEVLYRKIMSFSKYIRIFMLIKFFIYISLTRICIVLGQNLGISFIYPVPSYEKYVGWGELWSKIWNYQISVLKACCNGDQNCEEFQRPEEMYGISCCGSEPINQFEEICCEDVARQRRQGSTYVDRCCGNHTVAYDQTCCQGIVWKRSRSSTGKFFRFTTFQMESVAEVKLIVALTWLLYVVLVF